MNKKKKTHLSCDWGKRLENNRSKNRTTFYKYKENFSWKGIKTEKYKSKVTEWSAIVRQTLIGNRGESIKSHLRYFEIAPGGYSSLEMHKHEHVVIGVRGKGICSVGKKRYTINFLDVLYIEPQAIHQLKNPFHKPFGFLCIVNAKRDRPKIISITNV